LITGREPGFYRLRYGRTARLRSRDIDGAEGDFTKLDFAEFILVSLAAQAMQKVVKQAAT